MGKKSPKAPDYQAQATEQGVQERNTAQFNTGLNRVNQTGPTSSTSWSLRPGADPMNPQAGDYIQRTTLTPDQQALLDIQEQLGQQQGGQISQAGQLASRAAGGVQLGAPSMAGLPGLEGGIDPTTSATPGGYGAQRDAVTNALMARAEPDLAYGERKKENSMTQSGIEKGTDAWNREEDRLSRARDDSRMNAILAGGQEQSRLAGLDMAQQGQAFTQGMASNEADRQARMQGLTERTQLQDIPLAQYSQLYGMGMAQPQAPAGIQYPGYSGGAQAGSPDLLGASNAQYQAAQQAAAQKSQSTGQTASSLATLGMLAYFMSDERLKHDLKFEGMHPLGIPRYSWKWEDGSPGYGVMAQDVEKIRPDAVATNDDGFLMVNYDAIGGF